MITQTLRSFTGYAMALAFAILTMMAVIVPAQTVQAQCAAGTPPACQVCVGAGGMWVGNSCEAGAGNPELIDGNMSVFAQVVNILSFISGAVAVIMLVVGGLRYVISNGDANAIGSAKNTILYAIVGLVIVFAARSIILFVIGNIG